MNCHEYDMTDEDAIEADTDLLGNCADCGAKVFDNEPHKTIPDFFVGAKGTKFSRDLYYCEDCMGNVIDKTENPTFEIGEKVFEKGMVIDFEF